MTRGTLAAPTARGRRFGFGRGSRVIARKGDEIEVVAFVCGRSRFCLDRFGRRGRFFGGEGEEVEIICRFGSGFVRVRCRLRFCFGGRRFFAGK